MHIKFSFINEIENFKAMETNSETQKEENMNDFEFDKDHDRRSWLVLKRMMVYILLIVLTPISVCVLGKVHIFESIFYY